MISNAEGSPCCLSLLNRRSSNPAMPSPVALLASLRLHITFLMTLHQAYRAIHSVLAVGTLTFLGPQKGRTQTVQQYLVGT
ncbi:hypothetical protein RU639_009842 [Aspergillus parasiticus]